MSDLNSTSESPARAALRSSQARYGGVSSTAAAAAAIASHPRLRRTIASTRAPSATGAASAAEAADVNVNPFICQDFQGRYRTVPAGSTITLWQGVSAQTLGILTAFLSAQTTTITVDGTAVDVSDDWPAPEKRPTGDWATAITYPTGIALQAGQSLTVVWMTTLARPVQDVFDPAAGGADGKPDFNADSVTYAFTVTAD